MKEENYNERIEALKKDLEFEQSHSEQLQKEVLLMGDTFDETSQKISQLNNEIKEQREKNMRLVMARAEEVKFPRNADPQYS